MNKLFAVFKREYLQTVRKKMFIIMTFLLPFLMGLLLAVPAMLVRRGLKEKQVVVVDGTGKLAPMFEKGMESSRLANLDETTRAASRISTRYVSSAGRDPKTTAEPYLHSMQQNQQEQGAADAVVVVPASVVADPEATVTYYSRSSADVIAQERVSRTITRALQRLRIENAGVGADRVDAILNDVHVDAVQLSKSGEEKRGGEANLMLAFVFGALLMVPVFVYGVEIMRGIIQEKNDRVVEVLISSISPTQLLSGKILGLAAVGLTQTAVWMAMAAVGVGYSAMAATMAGFNVSQMIRPGVLVFFLLFFVLGYLLMVCIYAIGGAACNSERDAQQLMAPILMIMMIPWFLMMPILTNPDSSLAVGLSMVPFFAPMTMFARILVSEPPVWQILLSIVLTIGTIYLMLIITAKIFRIGVLTYGKRPTIPEMWRWLKVA